MMDANPEEEVKKRTFHIRDAEGFNSLFDDRGFVKESGKMVLCDRSIAILRGVNKIAYMNAMIRDLKNGRLSVEPRAIRSDDQDIPIPDADICMAILFHPDNAPSIYMMFHRS